MTRILRSRIGLVALTAAIAIAGWVVLTASSAPNASAHPLGNFTINRYSRLELYSDAILVRYVLDMAEIPAFREIDDIDTNGDGTISDEESADYLDKRAADLRTSLTLSIDGHAADLELAASEISYPEGQAGLDTVRIALWLRGETSSSSSAVDYHDGNYSDRIGWREIVVSPAERVHLDSANTPTTDASQELTVYPDDLLASPPDVASVGFNYDATDGPMAPSIDGLRITDARAPESAHQRSGSAFASLIDVESATLPVVLVALLAAFAFGAIHALEPGHGKTLVAAYFVGIKGTARQAIGLGLIIAATHTVGVLAIGVITIFGSRYILPEDLYPWLSLGAGIMVLALGVRLVLTRMSGFPLLHRLAHVLRHGHPHHHHEPADETEDRSPPWRTLIAIGLADGLVPSPSTLVVLLAAISLDRVGLGLALIVAFSVGLAAVLTAISLGLVYVRRVADWFSNRVASRRTGNGLLGRLADIATGQHLIATYLPIAGAIALVAVGATLTLRALPAAGLTMLF